MKPGEGDTRPPIPSSDPLEGKSESGSSGAGAQTALLEMLRKRRMRVARDPDSELPPDESSGALAD